MTLRFVPVRRDLWLPPWAVAIVLLWGALVAAHAWAQADGVTCTLRALTGIPCPTCGGTRAVAHLGAGDPAGAIIQNPLVILGGAALAVLLAMRLTAGRGLALSLTPRQRRCAWSAAIVLVLASWAYQVARHMG